MSENLIMNRKNKREKTCVFLCEAMCLCCMHYFVVCLCVCVQRGNTFAKSPNLFICKLDYG